MLPSAMLRHDFSFDSRPSPHLRNATAGNVIILSSVHVVRRWMSRLSSIIPHLLPQCEAVQVVRMSAISTTVNLRELPRYRTFTKVQWEVLYSSSAKESRYPCYRNDVNAFSVQSALASSLALRLRISWDIVHNSYNSKHTEGFDPASSEVMYKYSMMAQFS